MIGANHPCLWKFIDKLKEEQGHTEFRLIQAEAGAPPPAKRLKYRDLDQRLASRVSEFGTDITLTTYLTSIAYNIAFHV